MSSLSAADTQRARSDALFNLATSSDVIVPRKDTTSAKEQRKWLLAQVRNAVIENGKELVSASDGTTFSAHGSLFHRLHVRGSHDIDVYVGLDGAGLNWGGTALVGRPGSEGKNLRAFQLPLTAAAAAQWMFSIVRGVLAKFQAGGKVSQGRRGAAISGFGPKRRDYDIIPAFLFRDADGHTHHIIPAGDCWERNPTSRDMRLVIELDAEFSRDQQGKILGYRDLVKLLKRLSAALDWKRSHDITSFMLRFAVSESMQERSTSFNHKQLARAIATLQEWLNRGFFLDPYTNERHELRLGLPPLNSAPVGYDLSPVIYTALDKLRNA